ncbi:peroxiredoxin [Kangiella sp. TOML190]|uniref:peroxiredoxin n=1 Tax=Kangiella sp. TOML190 TaxID=2931351 RepID=UPI00203DA823|nr:peroxiredoxin [Kangiella sp. TOML190]
MKKLFVLLSVCGMIFAGTATASDFVGQLAPNFKLMAQDGSLKSLDDYKDKWLVLYFYPKDDTPGCTTEAKNFRDAYDKFQKINTHIVGISLDHNSSHQEFSKKYQLPFDILSDTEKKAAKAYKVMGGFGPVEYTKRQTFIIDPDGNIVFHFEKVNADEHSKNVMAKLTQLQKELL